MLLVLFVYSSCTEEKRPTPQPKARINVTPQTKEAAAISQLTASIDEISANLDVISAREGLLYKTTEHTNKKTKSTKSTIKHDFFLSLIRIIY